MDEFTRSILVVDNDEAFLGVLKNEVTHKDYPLKFAHSGARAQAIITDRKQALSGIFINATIEKPGWISVLRCACMSRPATPLYMLYNDENMAKALAEFDMKRLGVKKEVFKPTGYRQMLDLIAPIAVSFDSRTAIEKARQSKVQSEFQTDKDDFISIRAEDFLSGSKSFFDVYVLLGDSRYLKLLHAGDAFTLDRLETYLKKGVTYFYIKKEVQEHYVSYCDHVTTALLKHKGASIELKASQTLNQGEEVMRLLTGNGVTSENLRYADKFVANVNELARQVDKQAGREINREINSEKSTVSAFMRNVAAYEHGVGTALLSGMLANALSIETEKPTQIIGMAALFHDVGLQGMPAHFLDEDESKMTASEKKLYYTHPEVAVLALKEIKNFHPGALQAIEQHHMRLGGQGFPRRGGATPVTKVAEIIGICDELNRLMCQAQKNPQFDIMAAIEAKIRPVFSQKLFQFFKQVFYPKLSVPSDKDQIP